MRRLLFYVLIQMLAGCSQINPDTDSEQVDEEMTEFKKIKVELYRLIDGDTLAVNYKGEKEQVRLLLVDSPETSHPRLGEQPYGREAKEFVANLIEKSSEIELEFDIGPKKDKYGRFLAYVYVDGKMLQERILKEGLARVAYIYPPNTRYVDKFNAIQKKAQQQGIGIWKIEKYVQEDGFRPEIVDPISTKEDSSECLIKGNVGKDKIYHTTQSPWYKQTKAEVMFCTEAEAERAGFRPPIQ